MKDKKNASGANFLSTITLIVVEKEKLLFV